MNPSSTETSTALDPARVLVVIPALNEAASIRGVVEGVRNHLPHVVVIDDGSTDATSAEAKAGGAEVLRSERNEGKGGALVRGFRWALEKKMLLVLTLDADGQHDPRDIPKFLEAYQRTGIPVLIGNRMWNPEGMPWLRRMTNRGMSRLLSALTGRSLPDSQNGFRLYEVELLRHLTLESRHYEAESEILLRLGRKGLRMDVVRIDPVYHAEQSKISPLLDSARFIRMLYRMYTRSGRH